MDPTSAYLELSRLPADSAVGTVARRAVLLATLSEAQGRATGIATSANILFEQLADRGALNADLRVHWAAVLELTAAGDPQAFQKAVSMQQVRLFLGGSSCIYTPTILFFCLEVCTSNGRAAAF